MYVPVGNDHKREWVRTEGRTPFQVRHIAALARLTDFDFFCCNPGDDSGYRGPVMLIFYTKDGKLHAHRVGQNVVIREFN